MTRFALLFLRLSLAVAPGCTRDLDPCLKGSLVGDRCVLDEHSVPADAGESPPDEMDAATDSDSDRDAGAPWDDADDDVDAAQGDEREMDIVAMLPDGDADLDAAESDTDRSELDAPADAPPEATSDAVPDAGDSGAMCEIEDIARWHDFHLSSALITQVGSCWGTGPGCSSDTCPMSACLRQQLDISGCDTCIAGEATCAAVACADRCGTSTDNESCRACVCSHGCVDAFATCSGATLDVCADCDERTCTRISRLRPELIMTAGQLLL